MPALFGSSQHLAVLLRLRRDGTVSASRKHPLLEQAGIIVRIPDGDSVVYALEKRHPLYRDILKVLNEHLEPGRITYLFENPEGTAFIAEPSGTLGHREVDYDVLHVLAHAAKPVAVNLIRRILTHRYPNSIAYAVKSLVEDGLVVEEGEGVVLSTDVTPSYHELIVKMSKIRAQSDARYRQPDFTIPERVFAFNAAADGAPRFFGTDVRMRNLMALAVHGPLWHKELKTLTGAPFMSVENRDHAPFGRGDVVRMWDEDGRRALALDPTFPLHHALRRFLIALERVYPIPQHVADTERPVIPETTEPWNGDRFALFGSPLPTLTLMSLMKRGWTFEAHVCAVASDYYREVVKKAIRRLEDEGVLAASRKRGPGFGPRLLRLAETCPARLELWSLIDSVADAWPDLAARVEAAFENDIPAKTKAYFWKRGLLF